MSYNIFRNSLYKNLNARSCFIDVHDFILLYSQCTYNSNMYCKKYHNNYCKLIQTQKFVLIDQVFARNFKTKPGLTNGTINWNVICGHFCLSTRFCILENGYRKAAKYPTTKQNISESYNQKSFLYNPDTCLSCGQLIKEQI